MMTKEELIKYIGDFGERYAAIQIGCEDCPLYSSCEKMGVNNEEATIGRCENIFKEFYASKTRTKAKITFADDNEERVPIGRLEKGDCFLYEDKVMVITKVNEARVEAISFGDVAEYLFTNKRTLVEPVMVEITVRRKKK